MVSAPISTRVDAYGSGEAGHTVEASTSGIAWPPILAGAFAIAATSLILLALGSGFGLSSVSPWPNSGVSATTFTVMMAIWLTIVHGFRPRRVSDRPASHETLRPRDPGLNGQELMPSL